MALFLPSGWLGCMIDRQRYALWSPFWCLSGSGQTAPGQTRDLESIDGNSRSSGVINTVFQMYTWADCRRNVVLPRTWIPLDGSGWILYRRECAVHRSPGVEWVVWTRRSAKLHRGRHVSGAH
ncbi:hypothetical protein BU16DRAFT_333374 [Lophium mytilinum]|uniref:Uncharacterized protein n=1 Tax=Lophium mytilinum TaxID=390894 RepID=A0A6A6R2M5_9PEZI|nr:hypothetical protein BU16DRAFT_333374 [Lophium mytilinum]